MQSPVEGMEAEERRRRPELGTCLAGKYEVEKLLGEGSMGAVYAARNLTTGKRVAIKWLIAERETDYALVDRFRREARAAGRVDHPNVVTIFDVGTHDNAVFLVMELLHGEPLSDILMRGRLEPEETIGLMIPVMRGVAAAHASGVVHRDLKPENVFVCRAKDGTLREPKVLDFGISKLVGDAATDELRATRTGVVIGTPTYMSPEQIAGAPDIDSRIDVYALGVMLYEMLAGRPPFTAGTYTALVVQIATATPPDLRKLRPDIDAGLVSVIEKAMARDRDARFETAEELARALEPFGTGTSFRPEAPAWSIRVGPSRAGSDKFTSTVDGKAPVSIRPSAPTISAETMESGLRETGAKTARTEGAEADEPALARPSAATEDSFRVESADDKRRMVFIGAGIGAVLLIIGLVLGLTLGGDDEEPPVIDGEAASESVDEPTETAAAAEATEPATEEDSEEEAEPTESAEASEASEAEASADTEAEASAAAEEEAVEPSTTPTVMRAPRRRARRRRSARSAMATAETMATEPTETETMATMRRGQHRAGTLSVDEF